MLLCLHTGSHGVLAMCCGCCAAAFATSLWRSSVPDPGFIALPLSGKGLPLARVLDRCLALRVLLHVCDALQAVGWHLPSQASDMQSLMVPVSSA